MQRRARPSTVGTLLLVTALAGALAATTPPAAGAPSLPVTDRPGAGEDPVALAADRYDVALPALRRRVATDDTVHVAATGRVYFVEPATAQAPAPERAPARAAYPLDQTFALHSSPGSRRTIYLDFDGHTVTGTLWNSGTASVPGGTHPAWDPAGNGAAFDDAERAQVQSIFQRVAEDFAPFDVDVTTQDPGAAAIDRSGAADTRFGTRVLVTPSSTAQQGLCGGGCGGIALFDVFDHHAGKGGAAETHAQLQPAWIFPQGVDGDVKAIAEAASHEVGHTLGLEHDGTSTSAYYSGHGPWAPIMGVAYERPVTQWAQSTYPDARLGGAGVPPQDVLQTDPDDLAVMAGNGLPFRADEAGATVAGAPALPAGPAYISRRGDQDVYALGTCRGSVSIDATPAAPSPNLDIELAVLAPDGAVVATSDPPASTTGRDTASGLAAGLDGTNVFGPRFLRVDGVGHGTAQSGYDDYGSLGAYSVTVTGCDGAVSPPPVDPPPVEPTATRPGAPVIGRATPGRRGAPVTATVRWSPPARSGSGPVRAYRVLAHRLSARGTVLRTTRSKPLTGTRTSLRLPRGRYRFAVQARNHAGWGRPSRRSNPTRAR